MDASQVAIASDRIPDLVEVANHLRGRRSIRWLTDPMQVRRARHVWRDPSGGEPTDPGQPTRQYSAARHSAPTAPDSLRLARHGPSQFV